MPSTYVPMQDRSPLQFSEAPISVSPIILMFFTPKHPESPLQIIEPQGSVIGSVPHTIAPYRQQSKLCEHTMSPPPSCICVAPSLPVG